MKYLKEDFSECVYDQIYQRPINISNTICLYRCTFISIISNIDSGSCIYINTDKLFSETQIISDCVFKHCSSNFQGGSIYINLVQKTNIKIINSSFENNSAVTEGGAIFLSRINYSIINCTFKNNSLYRPNNHTYGGCLYIVFSNGEIEKSSFNENSAHSYCVNSVFVYSYGGSIYFRNSSCIIKNSIFTNNSAYITPVSLSYNLYRCSSYGGSFCLFHSNLEVVKCNFLNNFASGNTKKMTINAYGGVVYGNETCVLNFAECIFDSNYVCDPFPAYKTFSHFFGGGIYLSYCELCLINCDLVNNSAYLNAIRPASLNGAGCYAGFAYLDSTNSTFKNCNFFNNSAITMIDYYSNSSPSCYGGVIYTSHFSYDNIPVYLNLTKCEFINNKAYVTHHGSSYGNTFFHLLPMKTTLMAFPTIHNAAQLLIVISVDE